MRPAVLLCLAAAASVAAAGRVPAAEAGAVAGSVRTTGGAALPHLVLVVDGPGGPRTVVTGPEGRYRVQDLEPGRYTVTAEAPGLVALTAAAAEVGGAEVRLDLVLGPAPVREQVLVSATRQEAALSTVGVAATVLDRERIEERAAPSLLELLQEVPGVAVARAGGVGLQASAFVRGGESRFARILVDGVPVNQPGGAFDFGSALPLELERVEVVRGAASSLYGTDALAGTVHLVTRRGEAGPPELRAEAEGGRFAWKRGQGAASGRRGGFDWNVGLLRLETDNDEPNSAFHETAGAASLGASLGAATQARLVLRGAASEAGTPGPTAYGRPDLDARLDRDDLLAGASLRRVGEVVTHELRAGLARSQQLSRNPLDSGSYLPQGEGRVAAFPRSDFADPAGFQNDTDRLSLGYQVEALLGARHLVVVGAEMERETGALGSPAEELLEPSRTNVGAYVQDRVLLGSRLYLALGARLEHNASFGTRAVPRAAAAYRLGRGDDALTLRASAGAGIKEPDFFQSFGTSFFARGNPELEPERSRTYDLGLEQRLLGSRLRASATAFHHDYLDQIAYTVVDFTTFQGSYVNLGRTQARGLELALEAAPRPGLALRAQYALTDGDVIVSAADFDPVYAAGKPLLRRPQHQGALSAHARAGRLQVGATVAAVGGRADSDFVGLGLDRNGGYARVDARARYAVTERFEAFLAAENLLDREYQDVLGYPALGRALRLGLRLRAGGTRP
jgi:vitamin B12 transporter